MARQKRYNDYLKEYRKLAKKADQRLVRLEKLSQQKDFAIVKQYAYRRAMFDIVNTWGGNKDKPRFNTKPPKGTMALKAKIQDIQNFLNKPTSTKSGIINIYQHRADTLNKDYDLGLQWYEVAELFKSALFVKLSALYGSSTVLKTIATMRQSKKNILEDFQKNRATHVKTEDDDIIIDDAIKRATRYYKKDVKKLLNQLD